MKDSIDTTNFNALVETTNDESGTAIEQISLCLDLAATALLDRANALTDLCVTSALEQMKSDTVRMWRKQAGVLKQLDDVLDRGHMPALEFLDEISEMLNVRMADLADTDSPATVVEILLERSRNIAQAFSGRILRENK